MRMRGGLRRCPGRGCAPGPVRTIGPGRRTFERGALAVSAEGVVERTDAGRPTEGRLRYVARVIASGTHGDIRIAREAVEGMAKQLQGRALPLNLEHDPTQPPVGRVLGVELVELDDGELALERRHPRVAQQPSPGSAKLDRRRRASFPTPQRPTQTPTTPHPPPHRGAPASNAEAPPSQGDGAGVPDLWSQPRRGGVECPTAWVPSLSSTSRATPATR